MSPSRSMLPIPLHLLNDNVGFARRHGDVTLNVTCADIVVGNKR
jgi:hypothetical protein